MSSAENSFGNVIDLHGLKVVLLPGSGVPASARTYYDTAYEAWKTVWKKTLLELDGSDQLFSDHFTRQDFHLTIFHGPRCVAAVSFRRVDLTLQAALEDSWLKIWPREVIQSYREKLRNGMMTSWFYVDPDYRRAEAGDRLAGFEVSNRVAEMVSYFVVEVQAEVTFGGVRNNRSVNRLIEPTGCKVVIPGMLNHGVEVDLVTWLLADAQVAMQKYTDVTQRLWASRIVFNSESLLLAQPNTNRKSA